MLCDKGGEITDISLQTFNLNIVTTKMLCLLSFMQVLCITFLPSPGKKYQYKSQAIQKREDDVLRLWESEQISAKPNSYPYGDLHLSCLEDLDGDRTIAPSEDWETIWRSNYLKRVFCWRFGSVQKKTSHLKRNPMMGTKIVDLTRREWQEDFNLGTWKCALETGVIFNAGVNLLGVWKSVPFSDQGHLGKNILL